MKELPPNAFAAPPDMVERTLARMAQFPPYKWKAVEPPHYFKRYAGISLLQPYECIVEPDWTPEEIAARQAEMIADTGWAAQLKMMGHKK